MSELDWRKPVCGWCDLEAASREEQRAHAMVCTKSPVVAEVAHWRRAAQERFGGLCAADAREAALRAALSALVEHYGATAVGPLWERARAISGAEKSSGASVGHPPTET